MVSAAEHDQLPSVEGYKASVGYRKHTIGSPKTNRSSRIVGNDAVNQDHSSGTDVIEDTEDSCNELPNVDEYKAAFPPVAKRRQSEDGVGRWKFAFFFLLLVLASLIVGIAVPLFNKDDTDWWLEHSDRYQDVEDFVVQAGISTSSDLANKSSPQHMAAKWIANKDAMQMSIPKPSSASTSIDFIERYVLAVFYYATGGPQWKYQLNFLTGEHVCTWYGMFQVDDDSKGVSSTTGDYATLGIHACRMVDERLVPFTVFLPDNNLVGNLPEEMQFLDRLEILNIPYNVGLTGELPAALARMESLKHISMQWCGFTSTIPSWVSGWKNLMYLGLGNNQLTGTIPGEFFMSLSNLQVLGLDDNALRANIEEFHRLTNIKYLYLESNQITGSLSDALFASLPSLVELDASNNELGGTLPDDLFNHSNDLQVLDLSNNDFTGLLPVPGWDMHDLELLALHDNKLSGTIPSGIVKLRQLVHLDLSGNSFGGSLPIEMGEMKQLKYLFVGTNPFDSAPIPSFVMELTNMRDLSFKNSRLVGPIPDFLGYLTNLEFLDLHFNKLTGSIPKEIGNLVKVQHLLLKSNNLTGSLPSEMSSLSKLDVFIVDKNDLVGNADPICKTFPRSLSIQHFVSDCSEEMECSCCNLCCSDNDVTCNTGDWNGNLEWEKELRQGRVSYTYDMGSHIASFP